MEKLFEWIQDKKNRKKILLIVLIAFFGPIIIIYGLYKLPYINELFVSPWNAGEILGYLGAFYTLLGTAIFGSLALWLNYVQKQDNDSSQKRLDDFNTRLINIDEKKVIPVIDVAIGEKYQSLSDKSSLELIFNNIGENAVKGLNTFDFILKYNDNTYPSVNSYLGGIASKDKIRKFYDVHNININFRLCTQMEISIKLTYLDILDRRYRKEYTIYLNDDESEKLRINKEEIKDCI